ncbi:hypothetical protein OROHE_021889 [Orobanche hederae]
MAPSLFPKLVFISILSSLIYTHDSYSQCIDDQKSLLLQLKNELIFNSSISTKLVQWNQRDDQCCCHWYGVKCDAAGHVISLQLDNEAITGGIGDSSTLFRLMYLEKLNLVPAEISSLTRLISLDISKNFDVKDYTYLLPLSLEHPNLEMLLQNMSRLRELYLDNALFSSHESGKWSHIISLYLPQITTLSLARCRLSGPMARAFWQLDSLSFLRLDHNNLSEAAPDLFTNFPNLTTLSLVYCSLTGSFPNAVFHIPTLQHLDLSQNEGLGGSIPPFTQTRSLKSIRLTNTEFSGLIPSSISNLKTLSHIDLFMCQFTGSIPSTFANLTELTYVDLSYNLFTGSLSPTMFGGLPNLVHLGLRYNSFTGYIPQSLFTLPSLLELHLDNNQFIGKIEEFPIVNVSDIVSISLSGNRLEGPIPNSLFHLYSLETLLLNDNLFNGTFQLDKIQSLANLTRLDLSRNNLTVDVGNDNSSWYGFPKIYELRLASCNIMHGFPRYIKHFDMRILDLSNNQIDGEIPRWIWSTQLYHLNLSFNLLTNLQMPYHIPASLQFLDLQSNQLRGDLHLPIPSESDLEYLLLANNSFSGSIPTSLCTATHIDILDLSMNRLSGRVPPCLLENIISVLDLGRNNISGTIPDNFPLNCSLQHFDLNSNALQGKIPKSFKRCTSLKFMNVGNNIINDTFPCHLLPSTLHVLVLRSNRFHGVVKCHMSWPKLQVLDISSNNFSGTLESINFSSWRAMVLRSDSQLGQNPGYYSLHSFGVILITKGIHVELVNIWPEFNAIDFSCNDFGGEIPKAIGDLSLLYHLNFSHNSLNGSIPKSFGQFKALESLDLSQNQLRGTIPVELVELTFLSVLNLSYNNLVGEIPNGRQFQTFSADSFKGNTGLCGFNLNISCSSHSDDVSPAEDENEEEIGWGYVSAAVGFVVGLGSIMWLLLFCRDFREKCFNKLDEVFDEILDARDRRRRQARTVVRNRVRTH